MRNKFQPKKQQQTSSTMVDLPSKANRLAFYRRVERVVSSRIDDLETLLDPRSLKMSFFSSSSPKTSFAPIGMRKRQLDYFKLEFLPTVSAALLLEIQDLESSLKEISSTKEQEQPIECISLLVSNMVLVSKGNYDARVRSILKTVCVQALLELTPIPTHNEEEFPSRALFFLTEQQCKTTNKKKKRHKKNGDDPKEHEDDDFKQTSYIPKLSPIQQATIQFESIERAIATDILKVLVERDAQEKQIEAKQTNKKHKVKDAVVRGLQITTMGVFVGSLFAVTGGLAAPGLVAAIAAFGIHGSVVFATLTTTTALASLFGVVGGGLGAYKMSKRVKGLGEWKIRKETSVSNKDQVKLRGLHAHVCVSGWLADKCDFQRPFGVQPNDPKASMLESLQRFFCVYGGPDKVKQAKDLLKSNKGEEEQLWFDLAGRYGRNPDDLLPLDRSKEPSILPKDVETKIYSVLIKHVLEEESAKRMKEIYETSTMLVQMEAKNNEMFSCSCSSGSVAATVSSDESCMSPTEEGNSLKEDGSSIESENTDASLASTACESPSDSETRESLAVVTATSENSNLVESTETLSRSTCDSAANNGCPAETECSNIEFKLSKDALEEDKSSVSRRSSLGSSSASFVDTSIDSQEGEDSFGYKQEIEKDDDKTDHLQVIWDWEATYAGEMYTVTWETDFLLKLCRVASVLFMELSNQVTKQVLTNTLVGAAVAVPSALSTCAGVIDDPYQIISSRSEKAGVELAHCLLQSEEHRPISLVGYSFGARVIFSCLLELARHQPIWQERQDFLDDDDVSPRNSQQKKKRHCKKDPDYIDYKREPASIVEDVVLIGMPRTIDVEEWISCRELVGGRLVNCFNRKDWTVSYMINIRCWNGIRKTCGTHSIKNVLGVENYEVSAIASTHGRYQVAVPQILQEVGYTQPRAHA